MRQTLRESNLPIIVRWFLAFATLYYGYVYAFPFEQGNSSAPAFVKAIKDVAYVGLALALLATLRWHRRYGFRDKQVLAFAPFLASLLTVSALHATHTGIVNQVWENIKNVALYVPLYSVPFLVEGKTLKEIVKDLFLLIPAMGVLQCLFVVVYHGSGHTLWEWGIYAGLLGNPNSFALFLNLGVACLLATLPTRNKQGLALSYSVIALFALTILGTTSGSQLAILWFLLIFSCAFRFKHWKRYLVALAVCASVTATKSTKLDQALFTMKGAGSIVTGAKDPLVEGHPLPDFDQPTTSKREYVSRSVTVRRENWQDTIAVLSKGPDDILFGDFDTPSFKPMDGQYLVFMFNGGLLTLLSFLAAAAFVYLRSLQVAWKFDDQHLFGLNLMIAAFGISFLASRVLMYFPFNFMFFLIAGLAVSHADRVGNRNDT